jgi:carboxylate-amine ligase
MDLVVPMEPLGTSSPSRRPGTPAWARWNDSLPYSVGLEEEVMLLDAGAEWTLARRVDEVLPALSPELVAHVTTETQNTVLELATRPHRGVASAIAEARWLRSRLIQELEPMGLRAACAGTHPAALWPDVRISGGERHQAVYGSMRELARREPTFGLHVHIGVADPDSAILLYNRLRAHLPLLLALSANSPFWQGRDTGFASARTPIFQAFPRVGIPRHFPTYEAYVDAVDLLIRCHAIPEPTYLWWDVRPQPLLGTVEIRIMDVQSDVTFTHGLVALVQSLAHLELEEGFQTSPRFGQTEVLIENRFAASRDGMEARLIEPVSETRISAHEALARVVGAARPHAQQLDCEPGLDAVEELGRRNGATRQRELYEKTGSLAQVVETLAEEFCRRG